MFWHIIFHNLISWKSVSSLALSRGRGCGDSRRRAAIWLYGIAIWPCHMALPDGLAIWLRRMAMPYSIDKIWRKHEKKTNIYIYIYIYISKWVPEKQCLTLENFSKVSFQFLIDLDRSRGQNIVFSRKRTLFVYPIFDFRSNFLHSTSTMNSDAVYDWQNMALSILLCVKKRATSERFFESLRSREKVAPLPRRPINLLEMDSRFALHTNLSVVVSNGTYVGGIGMWCKHIGRVATKIEICGFAIWNEGFEKSWSGSKRTFERKLGIRGTAIWKKVLWQVCRDLCWRDRDDIPIGKDDMDGSLVWVLYRNWLSGRTMAN